MQDNVKSFGEVVSGLAKSPLGIIALFIVLVYGFASLVTTFHASSVKTSMHRIRLPSFLRSIFAEKVRAHRALISTSSSFWLNSKM